MAGLPWFELDVDFHESPKVRALASRLREPLADAYVARIYAYCYRHARDRFEPEVAAETLEEAARWRGRRGTLFDALFAVGVLERDAGRVVVHGVADRLAPHMAKRVVDAHRQRRRRHKIAEDMASQERVTRDVTVDVARDVTPDVTRESRTYKDKDKDKDKKLEAETRAQETDPPAASSEAAPHGTPPAPVDGDGAKPEPVPPPSPREQGALDARTPLPRAAEEYPHLGRLLDEVAAAHGGGLRLGWPRDQTTRGAMDSAARRAEETGRWPEAVSAVLAAHEADPHPSAGWYAKALHAAAWGTTRGAGGEPEPVADGPPELVAILRRAQGARAAQFRSDLRAARCTRAADGALEVRPADGYAAARFSDLWAGALEQLAREEGITLRLLAAGGGV